MNLFFNIVLVLAFVISIFSGYNVFAHAKSAIHEIYGAMSFLMATLFFCTIAIKYQMSSNTDRVIEAMKKDKEDVKSIDA